MIRLVVDAYLRDVPYPVITHVFRADTIEGVRSLYDTHLEYDAMLQGCTKLSHFLDFECWTIAQWYTDPTQTILA